VFRERETLIKSRQRFYYQQQAQQSVSSSSSPQSTLHSASCRSPGFQFSSSSVFTSLSSAMELTSNDIASQSHVMRGLAAQRHPVQIIITAARISMPHAINWQNLSNK
jgi:hypothetical protein